MRVTLDLKRLLHGGQITQAEFDKLSRLGRSGTGELGINVLIGFGVVSVAGSALLLNALTGIVLGLAIMAAGVAILASAPRWLVLGNVCLLVAALLFGSGLVALRGPTVDSFLMMATIFATGAIAAAAACVMQPASMIPPASRRVLPPPRWPSPSYGLRPCWERASGRFG